MQAVDVLSRAHVLITDGRLEHRDILELLGGLVNLF